MTYEWSMGELLCPVPTLLVLLVGLALEEQWGDEEPLGAGGQECCHGNRASPWTLRPRGPFKGDPPGHSQHGGAPAGRPPRGGCRGGGCAPDLPIMAARRGCRAEVTAARRGGGAAGGSDLKGQCPPSGGGGGGCGGRGTGTGSGSGGSGSDGRTEEGSSEPRCPTGDAASPVRPGPAWGARGRGGAGAGRGRPGPGRARRDPPERGAGAGLVGAGPGRGRGRAGGGRSGGLGEGVPRTTARPAGSPAPRCTGGGRICWTLAPRRVRWRGAATTPATPGGRPGGSPAPHAAKVLRSCGPARSWRAVPTGWAPAGASSGPGQGPLPRLPVRGRAPWEPPGP